MTTSMEKMEAAVQAVISRFTEITDFKSAKISTVIINCTDQSLPQHPCQLKITWIWWQMCQSLLQSWGKKMKNKMTVQSNFHILLKSLVLIFFFRQTPSWITIYRFKISSMVNVPVCFIKQEFECHKWCWKILLACSGNKIRETPPLRAYNCSNLAILCAQVAQEASPARGLRLWCRNPQFHWVMYPINPCQKQMHRNTFCIGCGHSISPFSFT